MGGNGNPVSGGNPKNRHTSGFDDRDRKGECKDNGYKVTYLSGSRGGDQFEGQDTLVRCANNNLPGSRSRDHSKGQGIPNMGYGENKLSGSRSGDHSGRQDTPEGYGKNNLSIP